MLQPACFVTSVKDRSAFLIRLTSASMIGYQYQYPFFRNYSYTNYTIIKIAHSNVSHNVHDILFMENADILMKNFFAGNEEFSTYSSRLKASIRKKKRQLERILISFSNSYEYTTSKKGRFYLYVNFQLSNNDYYHNY